MKKLSESLEMHVVATTYNLDVLFKNSVSMWSGVPYAELSALLSYLTFVDRVHHTHHWIAQGDPFYSDHGLFSRLYEATSGEIDSLAEKVVGLGSSENVDLETISKQVEKWSAVMNQKSSTVPLSSELARKSLDAEMAFLKFVDMTTDSLRECGMLTRGLDNFLAGLSDAHEGHAYLLKQRVKTSSASRVVEPHPIEDESQFSRLVTMSNLRRS